MTLPGTAAEQLDTEARLGLGGPSWLGWANVASAWLVPFCLGVAGARGARLPAVGLLLGGIVATAALVHWCDYPASLVGVPGQGRSNLNPPTLVAVSFGLAQVGMALLLRGPLTRLARRRLVWAVVAGTNLWAVRIFLWHQTALVAVTLFALGSAPLPGLHTAPGSWWWILARLRWLPVFIVVLLGGLWLGARIGAGRRPRKAARSHPQASARWSIPFLHRSGRRS